MSRSNKRILLGWLPRLRIVTNLGKIFVKENKGFLPLKNMFRYGLLAYSNHFKCFFWGSVGDFEDDV